MKILNILQRIDTIGNILKFNRKFNFWPPLLSLLNFLLTSFMFSEILEKCFHRQNFLNYLRIQISYFLLSLTLFSLFKKLSVKFNFLMQREGYSYAHKIICKWFVNVESMLIIRYIYIHINKCVCIYYCIEQIAYRWYLRIVCLLISSSTC